VKISVTALGLLFFALPLSAEDLISREDARKILSLPQTIWNAQVALATSAGLSSQEESYGGTSRQLIKGPDWELSTLPLYGRSKDAPDSIELKIAYKKGNPVLTLPEDRTIAICSQAFNQLKVEFSLLCDYRRSEEELQFTFLISKMGKRKDIEALNAKGIHMANTKKLEEKLAPHAKKLIDLYWSQLDAWAANRTATKRELIEIATKELPAICGKLVSGYALASGKSPISSREDREEFNFNSDFCVKATVHRRFPQPEFENPQIVEMLCEQHKRYEFNHNLCKRAGVIR
jgi:hypothetical protein